MTSPFSTAGCEFFSTSTDGRVLWWDIRKLSEPYEQLDLVTNHATGQKIGGVALEFESTMVSFAAQTLLTLTTKNSAPGIEESLDGQTKEDGTIH